jgi:hypothetical protein
VDIGPDGYMIVYKSERGIQKGTQVVFMPYPYIPSLKLNKVLALEKGLHPSNQEVNQSHMMKLTQAFFNILKNSWLDFVDK